MSTDVVLWLRAAHFIGLFLWLGGMFTVYWMLRLHAHAPKEAHEKFVLMERSLALMMDIASALAIGSGIAMIFRTDPNLLVQKPAGYMHTKLLLVVLGILPVHGIIRARIKKFGQGNIVPIPQWLWGMLLVAMCAIVILIERRPF